MNYDLRIKKKSGQILILVLLVVVVALAVGLSVASRNITNLKSSTQAEQSQRAFTAAEGGVEDVLSKLNNVANVMSSVQPLGYNSQGCTKESNGIANCSIATASGVTGTVKVLAASTYEKTVEPGDVAQINLQGYSGNFDVEWFKSGEPDKVSLEFTFICNSPSPCVGENFSGSYGQHREAYTTDTTMGGNQTGFSLCPGYNSAPAAGNFGCKNTFSVPVAANVRILRMKPFWDRVTIRVSGGGATFPVQTYEITSTATTDTGVSRKVEVKRDALPQLPAIFDYVLYSGGDIIK